MSFVSAPGSNPGSPLNNNIYSAIRLNVDSVINITSYFYFKVALIETFEMSNYKLLDESTENYHLTLKLYRELQLIV